MANVSFTGSCLETVTSETRECLAYVHYGSEQKQVAQLRFCLRVQAKDEDNESAGPQTDSGAASGANTPVHQIEAQVCPLQLSNDNLTGAVWGYDAFLNYRVRSDSSTAEKLCYRLMAEDASLRIFWDKKDLKDGEPWEKGFREGLQQSRKIMTLVSREAIASIKTLARGRQDNVLLEYELAIDNWETDDTFIVPVFVGEYISSGGQRALAKFSDFDVSAYPDFHSPTCSHRTIRETMGKLFQIQGIHLDPEDMISATKRIVACLGKGAQIESRPRVPTGLADTSQAPSAQAGQATNNLSDINSGDVTAGGSVCCNLS